MKYQLFLILFLLPYLLIAQEQITALNQALTSSQHMESDLQELCDEIGGRVTGSKANQVSVEWAMKKFQDANVSVRKEAFEMPVLWLGKATGMKVEDQANFHPQVVSKYQSPPGNYHGILVDGRMGDSTYLSSIASKIKGNIVLFESDLCLDIGGLFAEYGAAALAEEAARKYGASAVVFMSSRPKKLLYRFITARAVNNELPQLVMAREDAKRCLRIIREGTDIRASIDIQARTGPSFTSHNVIGEIKGSELPDEVIIVGAHLDSWALGTGANDNGCNVVLLIHIAREMKRLGIRAKRTLRFALWNGEEQGYFGSWAYVKDHAEELDNHKMAMSIDIGSGAINGFFTNGREDLLQLTNQATQSISYLGELTNVNVPIVGTDNFDFMLEGVPNLVGNHLSTNYGINYHASSDTYDKVDFLSLKRNSAIVANIMLAFGNGGSSWNLPRHSRNEIQTMFDANKLEYTMRMFNVWEPWISGDRGRK